MGAAEACDDRSRRPRGLSVASGRWRVACLHRDLTAQSSSGGHAQADIAQSRRNAVKLLLGMNDRVRYNFGVADFVFRKEFNREGNCQQRSFSAIGRWALDVGRSASTRPRSSTDRTRVS